jgi:hypothetical protein
MYLTLVRYPETAYSTVSSEFVVSINGDLPSDVS